MLGFSPLATRPLAATAAAPASNALSGSATMTTTSTGVASLSAAIIGATALAFAPVGQPQLSTGLAGASPMTAAAAGATAVSSSLSGAATNAGSATGTVGFSAALAGPSALVLATAGQAQLVAATAGAGALAFANSGLPGLSAGIIGNAALGLTAAGEPDILTTLSGQAGNLLASSGAPGLATGFAGATSLLVGATGLPTISAALAGPPASFILAAAGQPVRYGALPTYFAADYLAAAQALMPRGAAWPREPDAIQTAVLTALVQSAEQVDGDANELLTNLFPSTTIMFLDEWEATLGLPDPIAGPAPSTPKRQRVIAAKFAGAQGFSRNAIRSFCAILGYDVTLNLLNPFRVNQATVGQRLADDQWANTVTLDLAPSANPPFTDALGAWDLAFCIAGLQRMAPAHLSLIFNT